MDNNPKILLAEDDKNLGTILKAYLEAKGYPTVLCVNGEEAWQTFKSQSFDFCILDVMMPVKDGFTVAREIRQTSKIPIIFLTAKSMQDDKMQGFQIGADDYITKPFSMEELLARIQAIVRRTDFGKNDLPEGLYQIGKYTFDPELQILKAGAIEQKLTSREAMLLKMLCDAENAVLDRGEALREIWNDDNYFNARTMDVYITKLRKYLKEDPNIKLINVHGVGFKLVTR
jgi:DNA-binding response OmpR family regulator